MSSPSVRVVLDRAAWAGGQPQTVMVVDAQPVVVPRLRGGEHRGRGVGPPADKRAGGVVGDDDRAVGQ